MNTDGSLTKYLCSFLSLFRIIRKLYSTCLEAASGDVWRDEVLRLVNVERARAGLDPVTHNQTLEDQATQYACEMIHYDFWGHENPVTGTDLPDRAEQFGYDYYMIGENLAAGQSSPAQAMADWMASEGHRENILEPGGTEPPMELYKRFRGAEPSIEPLLERRGLQGQG